MPQNQNDKYSRLVSNTILFALSSFGGKILSFLMLPLYTHVLDKAEFGATNLVTLAANLFIPLVSLGLFNAVLRFGLDKKYNPSSVFTSSLAAILSCFFVLLLFAPLVSHLGMVRGYTFYLYIYVLVGTIRFLCSQFVRAKMLTRIYALDGLLLTAYTVIFQILFLVVFRWGVAGYLLAIICGDALSAIGLFIMGQLYKDVRPSDFSLPLLRKMLRFSLPLVPNNVSWWVITGSSSFFFRSTEEVGLYNTASRIPGLVTLATSIFQEAWQMSAIADGQDEDQDEFFSTVFSMLSGLTFIVSGMLILVSPFVMLLLNRTYYAAARIIPLLVLATVFSCLSSFLNSVYLVKKKSNLSMLTMLPGVVSTIALNFLLIPRWSGLGAAASLLVTYLLIFVIRVYSTRRLIHIDFKPGKLVANSAILSVMVIIMLCDLPLWGLWCGLLAAGLLALNISAVVGMMQMLLPMLARYTGKRKNGGSINGALLPPPANNDDIPPGDIFLN